MKRKRDRNENKRKLSERKRRRNGYCRDGGKLAIKWRRIGKEAGRKIEMG